MTTSMKYRSEILGAALGISLGLALTCCALTCDANERSDEWNHTEPITRATEVVRTSEGFGRTEAIYTAHNGVEAVPGELDLLCRVVELEAGRESLECREAVTAVILNRAASGIWGDTLTDVIYAVSETGQPEFAAAGNAESAVVQPGTMDAVMKVWDNGSPIPADVLFFRDSWYHTFYGAVDRFAVGAMYFSSSIWCEVE